MRFCPFCSAENTDEISVCHACGRRLPPLPPRRSRPPGSGAPANRSSTPAAAGALPPPVPARRPPATPTTNPSASGAFVPAPRPSGDGGEPGDGPSLRDALVPRPAAQRRSTPAPDASQDPLAALGRRESDRASGGDSAADPNAPAANAPIARAPIPSAPTLATDSARISARKMRSEASPPPTRIQLADRPFTPPRVSPVPEVPEPGLVVAARYAVHFGRARWQRRGAIRTLGTEIKQDTEALDQVLGAVGREARTAGVEGRVFSAENTAITAAEARLAQLAKDHGEVDARKAEEHSKYVDIERERNTKLVEAERLVDEAQKEMSHLDGQRRALRDKRKEIERRQKAYLKNAEDADRNAGSAQLGEARGELRRSAEGYRKEAAALEPERQDVDRRLAGLERPIGEATAKLDAAKAELDAAKRSLNDAREGHTHRLAELDSEQKRKSRETALAEAEIGQRLVTLGTLINLNRIDDPAFAELFARVDRIRAAITARTAEIERLSAERSAYDRGTLIRGIAAIGGALVLVIALLAILRAAI